MGSDYPQRTAPETIEQERALVSRLNGISDAGAIALNEVGWTSRIYLVGRGRYVFKFPRSEAVKREYVQELAALHLLSQTECPVRVPRLRWSHPDNDYIGYEGVVGREFAPIAARSDPSVKRAVGQAIGLFLKQLHTLVVADAPLTPLAAELHEFKYKYELVLAAITRDFDQAEQGKIKALIEEATPRVLTALGEDPVFSHGDLGLWNMILQDDGGVGVIDFGDAGYYDRARDFMELREPVVRDAALEAYGADDRLRAKIVARQKLIYLLDLPFFVGKEDPVGVARTVARIKADLA